jgi:integrase
MSLSTKSIPPLIRDGNRQIGVHHDEHGLYLQVVTNGQSWLQRLTIHSKRRWMGIGPYPLISLAKARDLGADARRLAKLGIDPIEQRKVTRMADVEQAATLTVNAAQIAYLANHEAEWRSDKTKARWLQTMADYVIPMIGQMNVGEVKCADVLRVLQPHWADKTNTMTRLRGWLFMVFESTRGKPGGLGEEQRNPADWQRLRHDLGSPRKIAPVQHLPAMPFKDVPTFMQRLREVDTITARALEFTILTCARSGPTLLASWSEIDFENRSWSIPGDHEKSGLDHRVPLPDRAVDILLSPRGEPNSYIYPGINGPYSQQCDMNMLELLKRLWGVHDLTVHGFRSSFRDWAGETTDHAADIAEAALSHKFGGTRGSYQRGTLFNKRRELMNDWAAYLAT